jgi:hypothetical protein
MQWSIGVLLNPPSLYYPHYATSALQCDLDYPVTPEEEIDIVQKVPEE